ncbi:MAG: PEGA domain-containing protein, partial [Deltaproteobacteria bacterium]
IFEVSADGYRTYRREMNVQPGSLAALNVELEPTAWAARLAVQSSVPTAAIYIDDQSVGEGPVERHVPSGDHRVEVHAPGYEVFRRTVHVGLDGVVRVDAHLEVEGHNRWMIPVGIGVGAVIIGAVVIGVVFGTSTMEAPYATTWGNTQAIQLR